MPPLAALPESPPAAVAGVKGIDPVPHLTWCRHIAIHVANQYKFHFQEREEVIAAAYLELVRLAKKFDPARLVYGEAAYLFRGWSRQTLYGAAVRAADAIRHGGFGGLGRGAEVVRVVVEPLSVQRTAGGDLIDMATTGMEPPL